MSEHLVNEDVVIVSHSGLEIEGDREELLGKGVSVKTIDAAFAKMAAFRFKSGVQSRISKKYGNGSSVAASLAIGGKISDATMYLVDANIHAKLAVNDTATTPYSKAVIKRHEEQYGQGSWKKTIAFAERWHAGRISGEIPMPIDHAGLEGVAGEIIELGGFVLAEIAKQKGGA